ncbi:patatin-like phospholipase family protein [Aspergillus mulundensis]|uniref:PNPLA domain-containing protein n=1 Tax=Aspergillus mulundensis TaxID=1810919 RepID=A0A3D8QNL0_9EURO|nr:hypothetical protein DSM5745_10155 [Aspergillus mulundensis]RDW63044.1 hypothetical protein DSM5745_10155 [Aspergillus mulundensis]
MTSTSGEVSIYPDPFTHGTETPRFYVDCEGFQGTQPVAAKYQHRWHTKGRQYVVEPAKGQDAVDRMDAKSEASNADSDPTTRVERGWRAGVAEPAALPAAIIIINAPPEGHGRSIADDLDAMTDEFFTGVDHELEANNTLRLKAAQKGDKTLKELLLRNFSSVHVHYIPDAQSRDHSSPEHLHQQNSRLLDRIQADSARVQAARAEAWTRFDAKQLSIVFDCAFQHLASGTRTPFDFSMYRQEIELPETVESHISQFLHQTLQERDQVDSNLRYAAEVIGSCLVRRMIKLDRVNMLYAPASILNDQVRHWCSSAMEDFLDKKMACSYIHPQTGDKCVNTKLGHARGHQKSDACRLADGDFVPGSWSTTEFLSLVKGKIETFLLELNALDPVYEVRRQSAITSHVKTLQSVEHQKIWEMPTVADIQVSFRLPPSVLHTIVAGLFRGVMGLFTSPKRTNTCFVCLFGRPEYLLPCQHAVCEDCFCDFGERDPDYPDIISLQSCILCRDDGPAAKWPVRSAILSLDCGGVRGIIELETLKRVESSIGIGLPIWAFFDLVVGTSAGGMIAIGLGVHRWSVGDCIAKFRNICASGFVANGLANTWAIRWVYRMFQRSIYKTIPLETSLRKAYPDQGFFGLSPASPSVRDVVHQPRVAVTTTVGTECRLIANYHAGSNDDDGYLDSRLLTWEAARCTSAAPMYFEEYTPTAIGAACRDGGLHSNNPV